MGSQFLNPQYTATRLHTKITPLVKPLTNIVQPSASQLFRPLPDLRRPGLECRQAIRFHWHLGILRQSGINPPGWYFTPRWVICACNCVVNMVAITSRLCKTWVCSTSLFNWVNVIANMLHELITWPPSWAGVGWCDVGVGVTIGKRLERYVADIFSPHEGAIWEAAAMFLFNNITEIPLTKNSITVDTPNLEVGTKTPCWSEAEVKKF